MSSGTLILCLSVQLASVSGALIECLIHTSSCCWSSSEIQQTPSLDSDQHDGLSPQALGRKGNVASALDSFSLYAELLHFLSGHNCFSWLSKSGVSGLCVLGSALHV